MVQIIDESGNIVNNYQYDEWGNILQQQEGIDNAFTAPSIGKTVYLPQQHKIKWWHASLYKTNQRIKNHSMNSVINALEEAGYN
ncbi:hypothetical protein D3C73_1142900 [compost metagenome]